MDKRVLTIERDPIPDVLHASRGLDVTDHAKFATKSCKRLVLAEVPKPSKVLVLEGKCLNAD